jgi:thioredoxin reductase (NADPH)
MVDVLITGGGPAGLTAAIYAARAGFSTMVLEEMAEGGQIASTSVVENYPGFPSVYGSDLAGKLGEHARTAGVRIVNGRADAFELKGPVKTVHTAQGVYQGKTLILAQGSRRRTLDVPGETEFTGRGVSYCATCDGNFFRGKTVAVVGGGNTALGDAVQLAALCAKVILIHRRSSFRAMEYLVKRVRSLSNIELRLDSRIEKIEGGEKVERVLLENTKDRAVSALPVDGVFVAVGVIPNTQLFGDVLPLSGGFVEAPESGVTPVPGVFVAGDIRKKELHQIVTAVSDGANAAYSAQLYLQNI